MIIVNSHSFNSGDFSVVASQGSQTAALVFGMSVRPMQRTPFERRPSGKSFCVQHIGTTALTVLTILFDGIQLSHVAVLLTENVANVMPKPN